MPADETQEHQDKKVAFYGAVVNAWVGTRMELDKTLLTISIALLAAAVPALTQVSFTAPWQVWCILAAAGAVFVTMHSLIEVLRLNATYLEGEAAGNTDVQLGNDLARLDRRARVALYVGIALALVVAGHIGMAKVSPQEIGDVRREQRHGGQRWHSDTTRGQLAPCWGDEPRLDQEPDEHESHGSSGSRDGRPACTANPAAATPTTLDKQ
jgi:hypothetical protein